MGSIWDFLVNVWSGKDNSLPVVFTVGLITNLVAWAFTRERQKKIRVFYKRFADDCIRVAIQNNGSRYVDESTIVPKSRILQLTGPCEIRYLTKHENEISLTRDKKGVDLIYIFQKSSIVFELKGIAKPMSQAIQKGYRGVVEVMEIPATKTSWVRYMIGTNIRRVLLIFSLLIIVLGIWAFSTFITDQSANNWYWQLRVLQGVFGFIGYLLLLQRALDLPRRIRQLSKLFGDKMT